MITQIYDKIKSYIYCIDTNDTFITTQKEELTVPLLSSKCSNDEATVVAKHKPMIVHIASLLLKKQGILVSNIFLQGENLVIESGENKSSFFIETIRMDDVVRFSCTISFNKFTK